MLSQNTNALGIIFPNSYDNTVPEPAVSGIWPAVTAV